MYKDFKKKYFLTIRIRSSGDEVGIMGISGDESGDENQLFLICLPYPPLLLT